MANTFKDLSDGDIVRECLESFHNKQTFLKTINRQYDSRFAKSGAKNGGTLLIRNPNWFTFRIGAVQNVQPIEESTQSLTVGNEYGIDIEWDSVEETLSIDDFKKRYIDPMMSTLAGNVEYLMMADFYKNIFNYVGTPATTPASLNAVMNARARLAQGLIPDEDNLHCLMDPVAMSSVTASVSAYFHKSTEIERAFLKGYVGEASSFKWWETASLPSHTNGTRDDTTPVVNLATGITSGNSTITSSGGNGTLKKGDVFTIAGVYAVNLETKAPYSHLQQFDVQQEEEADFTTIEVLPVPVTSGAKQNVYHATWTGSAALVFEAAGGSGAASATYPQPLAYHKDAFTAVFANLTMPYSGQASQKTIDGISMRLWKSSNITNDKHSMRLDVLCGWLTVRPDWAVRFRG